MTVRQTSLLQADRYWRRFHRHVNRHLKVAGQKELTRMGTQLQKDVRNRIRTGGAEGPPNADSTIERKGHSTKLVGPTDRGRVKPTQYAKSVIVTVTTTGSAAPRRLGVLVGVKQNSERVAEIALVHEFGGTTPNGARIPARPHWTPAIEELQADPAWRNFLRGKWIVAGVTSFRG